MRTHMNTLALLTTLGAGIALSTSPHAQVQMFHTSDSCVACHNGLTAPTGEDVSIGFSWRSSMMANAARDPYWHAGVRRESMDHPKAQAAIEHECSTCHMPMDHYQAYAQGQKGQVFANLPAGAANTPGALLAADGVGCALCHQIGPGKLGTRESFVGGFVIDTAKPLGQREVYGPYDVEAGLAKLMGSAAELNPVKGEHMQRSELCATCHTLFTHTLGPNGESIGTLPEQVPYLEWEHSAYKDQQSCQDCHMPVVDGETPISSVLGEPREHFSRHRFRGGNFFMPALFNRHAAELGVQSLPQELDATSRSAADHLRTSAARLDIEETAIRDGHLEATLAIANLAGHKLPSAYPSRRVWLHLTARDASGAVLFESGALSAEGSIQGNDNDADPARYEPHHQVITDPQQVQIYEVIMGDRDGDVTTGLLSGLRYLKDNRVLPSGFDKVSASDDVAVHGAAEGDADFSEGGDRVRCRIPIDDAAGPLRLEAELIYQPIGFRWAENLRDYDADEPRRFVGYWEEMRAASSVILARADAAVKRPRIAPAPEPAPEPEPAAKAEESAR